MSPLIRAAFAALLSLLAALSAAAPPAAAAPGPPPPTLEPRTIAGVHTDVVAPMIDRVDGAPRLVLASRADVDGQLAKRLDPRALLFHVEDDVRHAAPGMAPYDFLGPAGTPVWVAPESRAGDELWPGFSTEGVPSGVVDGNAVELTLERVEGPGAFHLYSVHPFTGPRQILTPGGPAWRIATGQHVHANWAFSAAGRYALTFRVRATVGGTAVTDTATYVFHVSALPTPAATTTTLEADPARPALGDDVALTARVTPAGAEGYVEFFDGDTSLGHDAVTDGRARLVTDALPLGERSLTARFTPKVAGTHASSNAAARTVTVVAESGDDAFAIAGVRSAYASGETLNARVRGWTLKEGQFYWWTIRPVGGGTEYLMSADDAAARGTLARELTTAYDGYEIRATLRGPNADGRETSLQRTPWVALDVEGPDRGSGRAVTLTGAPAGPVHAGDTLEVGAQAELRDGERLAWVVRAARYQDAWEPAPAEEIRGDGPWQLATHGAGEREWALQIVQADGTVAGRSAPLRFDALAREIQLEGVRSVYRVGDTLRASASVWPALPGVTYQWGLDWEPIPGATGATVEVPITADLDGKTLTLDLASNNGFDGWYGSAGFTTKRIAVTDAAPGEQVLMFDPLGGHYHQGGTIGLRLNADPAASDTDVVRWEWKRRGDAGFAPLPGASGLAHDLVAEQALDGTQIRATLLTADGEELAATEAPETIHVDDHGAAPRQKVAVGGAPDGHVAGDRVALRATVEPGTVLDRYRWLVQRAGAAEPEVVAGEHGATYAFTATEALDGARVSVAVTYADGTVAYGPSAPITLAVAPAAPGEEEPPPAPPVDPPVEEPPAGGEAPPVSPPAPPVPPAPAPTVPTAPAAPGPQGGERSRTRPAVPRVARLASRRTLRTGRTAVLARVSCPGGGAVCRTQAPTRVTVRIAGRRFAARVDLARTIWAGRRASVRLTLPRTAVRRLAGRRTTVAVPVTVTAGDRRIRTTVRVVLAG